MPTGHYVRVVSDLGIATGTGLPPGAPARRVSRPGWRDPRLWVGVVLVAGSVLLGARLLAAADDTVQVWAAGSDIAAGTAISEADLVAVRVRFADDGALAGYLATTEPLPADLRLTGGVAAGDLVPRSVLTAPAASGILEVPIAVDPERVPGSVTSGSVVDVYLLSGAAVVPDAETGGGAPARPSGAVGGEGPLLAAVPVLEAPAVEAGFGTTGRRQLVLAVPEADVAGFFAALSGLDDPTLTVVRRS